MPSTSRAQQRLMHGIAGGSIPAGHGRPSKAVAEDFAAADHVRGATKFPAHVHGNTLHRSGLTHGELRGHEHLMRSVHFGAEKPPRNPVRRESAPHKDDGLAKFAGGKRMIGG